MSRGEEATKSDTSIVEAFGRFAASGYKPLLFTKSLYKELSLTFGFIAHYDLGGFYKARFGDAAARVETLRAMGVDEIGHPLNFLEQRLRTMVVARGLIEAAEKVLAAETEQRERAELARLKAKYEADDAVDPLS